MTNAELEAAIDAEPEVDDGYLVYGDWLQERGDPRGELVALDRDLLAEPWGPGGRRLRERRRRILEEHEDDLLGRLVGVQPARIELDWHLGFVRSAVVATQGMAAEDVPGFLVEVLTHPSMRFLRSLELGALEADEDVLDLDAVIDAFASRQWPTLRELVLGRPLDGEWPVGAPVTDVVAAAPGLTSLEVCGAGDVGAFASDTVRVLTLHVASADAGHLDIARACPALSSLSISLGGTELSMPEVAAFATEMSSRLEHLGLVGYADANKLCGALALDGCKSLDLSMGSLSDVGAGVLCEDRERLGPLARIDVRECRVGEGGLGRLTEAFDEIVAGPQGNSDREASLLMDGASDATRRLQSAGHSAWRENRYADAIPVFESARRIARATGDVSAETRAIRALGGLTYNLGQLDTSIEHRRRVLSRLPGNVDAMEALAASYRSRGRTHQAEELLERALTACGAREKKAAQIGVELAAVQLNLGDWKQALERCQEALRYEKEHDAETARTWNILGGAYQQNQDYEASADAYRRALELEESEINRLPIELNLGQAEWLFGKRELAAKTYRHVADEARRLGVDRDHGAALANLGHLYSNWGKNEQAKAALLEAIPILQRAQNKVRLGEAYTHLAIVLMGQQQLDESEAAFEKAIAIHKETGGRQWESMAVSHLAGVHFDRGDLGKCEATCAEALAIQRSLGDRWGESTTMCQLGDVHLARADDDQAIECFERAIELSTAVRNPRWAAWNTGEVARVHHARGAHAEASRLYTDALERLVPIGDESMLGRIEANMAALEVMRGDVEKAKGLLSAGKAHVKAAGDEVGARYANHVATVVRGESPAGDLYADWLQRCLENS